MKEYIERAQLLKNLGYDETRRADVLPGSTFDIVLKEPAADVAEVRHGRWEFLGPNNLNRDCMCGTCSVCHVRSKYIVNTAICPNCGARMDSACLSLFAREKKTKLIDIINNIRQNY